MGRPELVQGNIEDIYAENGFIAVRDADFPKLGNIHSGSEFELNDHRAVVVGIAKMPMFSIFGVPTLYTTYHRAVQYVPNPRYTTSYVLVQPKSESDIPRIKQQVKERGYMALTKEEFSRKGGSMKNDHILDGDYVLVEKIPTANDGDVVVALIDGSETTLKRLYREPPGRVRLQPANAQIRPIVVPAESVVIQGRVIGVLRRY